MKFIKNNNFNTESMEINSIFTVTDFKTGKQYEETITGYGQATVKALRALYARHTKFVLDGFEIDGKFVPLHIKNR